MSRKSLIAVLLPVLLLLCLLPLLMQSEISDLPKGAIIGGFLGLALLALIKGKRKAR